ncbi:hypothetical protein BGZ49_003278 [Haplosporangium sp. Z 27]|nr:hypothetical protein BGZ49_003278 [Haplosporangium sp. Z 27]
MSDLSVIYKELLASEEGDILVKLKNGSQLKIISFLVKKRSPVFKTMLESSMKEAATGVVDLSSQYSLEAFREFMAYIYYNKLYAGSFLPLLFELLCIANYYEVDSYRTYISDQTIKLITNVPICLMIAYEAQKQGAFASKIYSKCIKFLVETTNPKPKCFDTDSGDSKAWCCSDHSTKVRWNINFGQNQYIVNGRVACIYSTLRKAQGYNDPINPSEYKDRCCKHRSKASESVDIDQLPDFIVDEVKSARDAPAFSE